MGELVVLAGIYAEILLPILLVLGLLVLGLLSRVAALGMIVFVAMRSYLDVAFHGMDAATIGAWLDRAPDAAILHQRLLWVLPLLVVVLRGTGWLSLDRLLGRR